MSVEQVAGDFLRVVRFEPGFDCENEPCQHPRKGDHGIAACSVRFLLIGPKGAAQFLLYSGWYPSMTTDDCLAGIRGERRKGYGPMPADLGHHAYEPTYEGEERYGVCDVLSTPDREVECFYDGSGLNAERPFYRLVREGDEGVWAELLDYYRATFDRVEASA